MTLVMIGIYLRYIVVAMVAFIFRDESGLLILEHPPILQPKNQRSFAPSKDSGGELPATPLRASTGSLVGSTREKTLLGIICHPRDGKKMKQG